MQTQLSAAYNSNNRFARTVKITAFFLLEIVVSKGIAWTLVRKLRTDWAAAEPTADDGVPVTITPCARVQITRIKTETHTSPSAANEDEN